MFLPTQEKPHVHKRPVSQVLRRWKLCSSSHPVEQQMVSTEQVQTNLFPYPVLTLTLELAFECLNFLFIWDTGVCFFSFRCFALAHLEQSVCMDQICLSAFIRLALCRCLLNFLLEYSGTNLIDKVFYILGFKKLCIFQKMFAF